MKFFNSDWRYVKIFDYCVCRHACEQTHKPSVDHEIAFTCPAILIYLTLRTHKSFMAHIGSDVRIPPVKCCAETTEPTHTQTHSQ